MGAWMALPISQWSTDTNEAFQAKLQDPASLVMEALFLFNNHLLIIIGAIVLIVSWVLFIIMLNFMEWRKNKLSKFSHSNVIEIIWTSVPALVLLSLASPSFSLLYSLDDVSHPQLTLKILGHQWYWGYEISDFNSCSLSGDLKYSSYMLPNEALKEKSELGLFRVLETNKKVLLPTEANLRLLVTAIDVLHSWTIPSFGVKVDACPGRLNQAHVFIKRFGTFFGQCSEICGVNHGFMPIVLCALPLEQYYSEIMKAILLQRGSVRRL